MRIKILLLTIYLSFLGIAYAVDIGELGIGARSIATGRTFAGGIDDAAAIFTNPAGIALNKNMNLTSMSGSLFNDVNYFVLGAVDNSPMGRFGVGYVNASTGGIPIMAVTGSGSTETIVQTGSTSSSDSILYFTYAAKLNQILNGRGENISLGWTLKYFFKGFTGGGTAMQDAYGAGMDADVGAIWDINPWARTGLTFRNFLPASLGGRFLWQKNSLTESIPMNYRLGCAINVIGKEALNYSQDQELILLIDYEQIRDNHPAIWHTGLEFWPVDICAFRVGIERAAQGGVATDNNFTAGIGTKYMGFTFDYAYQQLGDIAENTTHYFSIGYRGPDEEKPIKVIKKEEKAKLPVIIPQVVPKPTLVTFNDLNENYWAKKTIEYLATLGIMSGYPDGNFRPEQEITRGELAAILVKAKGFELNSSPNLKFSDVSKNNWVAPYIEMAVLRQYMSGYPDNTFRPNQKISRAEAAIVFAKFSGLYIKPEIERSIYEDVETKHWAASAISAGTSEGFFEYISNNKFEPKKFLTRAEVAEILSKTYFVKEKIKKLISGEHL